MYLNTNYLIWCWRVTWFLLPCTHKAFPKKESQINNFKSLYDSAFLHWREDADTRLTLTEVSYNANLGSMQTQHSVGWQTEFIPCTDAKWPVVGEEGSIPFKFRKESKITISWIENVSLKIDVNFKFFNWNFNTFSIGLNWKPEDGHIWEAGGEEPRPKTFLRLWMSISIDILSTASLISGSKWQYNCKNNMESIPFPMQAFFANAGMHETSWNPE